MVQGLVLPLTLTALISVLEISQAMFFSPVVIREIFMLLFSKILHNFRYYAEMLTDALISLMKFMSRLKSTNSEMLKLN